MRKKNVTGIKNVKYFFYISMVALA